MRVSCIMPTRGRREWAAQAVQCFLSQTWPDKELLILDDTDDASFPHAAGIPFPFFSNHAGPPIMYFRRSERWSIGRKRNELARIASGEAICHFDDDDWAAPDRIATQVRLLEESGL